MTDLALHIWWEPRDPSQADDARRLSEFVSGLPNFDSIYQSWLESPTSSEDWLKSPASRAEEVCVPLSEAGAKQLLIDTKARYNFPNWPRRSTAALSGEPMRDFRPLIYANRASRTLIAMSAPSASSRLF